MLRIIIVVLMSFSLWACATTHPSPASPATVSYLAEGKRDFESGYYKRAMQRLLPLACDGNAEAQYAVGYMYYYGYGVSQDTDVGYFWIKRSADQQYPPAVHALGLINARRGTEPLTHTNVNATI